MAMKMATVEASNMKPNLRLHIYITLTIQMVSVIAVLYFLFTRF